MNYELVVLDFHGVMTNHPERTVQAIQRAWTEFFGDEPPRQLLQGIFFRPRDQTLEEYLQEWFPVPGRNIKNFLERVRQYIGTIYIPTPELSETVFILHAWGVKMIVLTNGEVRQVERVVQTWGVRSFLGKIYGKENTPGGVATRPKPRPGILKFVLQDSGLPTVSPDRVLVVGDYYHDTVTARMGGADAATLVTTRRPNISQADLTWESTPHYVIFTLPELLEIVSTPNLDGLRLAHQKRLAMLLEGQIPPGVRRISPWLE